VPGGGMLTEVIQAAFSHQQARLTINYMPWKRGYRMVLDGKAAGTFTWQKTEEREKLFNLSAPLFADANLIYTTLPEFNRMIDLDERHKHGQQTVICIPLGWTVPREFVSRLEQSVVQRISPEKIGPCLELMRSGRAHILNVPPLTVHYELKVLAGKLGLKENPVPGLRLIEAGAEAPATTHILFARTKAGEAAATVFKKGFDGIINNGTYQAIITRHLDLYTGIDRARIFADLKSLGLVEQAP